MQIFNTKNSLQHYLKGIREAYKTIALVPTMGALHEGHLSLIQQAKQSADIAICSIFVNPTQFNDPKDLEKYPRPLENDIALLKLASCDVLFLPSVEEMYPDTGENWHLDLGNLEAVWEGEHRPGHFQGVTQIVYKLFTLTQPDFACFGQKDFQQVMVVQKMIDVKQLPIKLIICPIIRDQHGLALSSRNMRLSSQGKEKALILSKALRYVQQNFKSIPVNELTEIGKNIIQSEEGVTPEYFAICETRTLQQVDELHAGKEYVALVVAWVEGVRLIDNMLLNG
ncbi:pantoate--beta-alanine ligase [Sphingobacterium pedocola]|uniref:Pantothenate synthetase n=1 Tax=Sphingobacterium pedocola TaxID=2082722 RepID=A0ABR9T3Y2_9SPHI|nr:pantoate--beta-alanine ligase [Sphingobacterium pedocola]MBE8720058.1 pantoate--beta-alanine ligase [Sphingobacterium pedocola]